MINSIKAFIKSEEASGGKISLPLINLSALGSIIYNVHFLAMACLAGEFAKDLLLPKMVLLISGITAPLLFVHCIFKLMNLYHIHQSNMYGIKTISSLNK